MGTLVLACLAGCNPASAAGNRLDPLPQTTRPLHYRISVVPDQAAGKYTGRETIRFQVLKATRDVVLHSVGLEIEAARLDGEAVASTRFDRERERAIFRSRNSLQPGIHQLELRFSGSISNRSEEGIFTRQYTTGDGLTSKPHFTMLCCVATGRKFAPMWDETDLKAVFELEVLVPQQQEVVSNMPVAAREILGEGQARVRFLPTPKMSSYLLFFAMGEFDRIRASSGSTEIGVLTRRGFAERGRLALDSSVKLLQFFNDYFAMPYPLPKLDHVSLPGLASFGAMENWGSILYSERYLLAGPERSSETELRDSHVIIAHEMAHQWFGDLVTAGTWDDLWLNEGFANWMESKATEHFHPEWQIWMQDGGQPRESAMRFDARERSFPIVPNHSFNEEITYIKSGQVIRMIEAHVGADRFRDAMRLYVREHAYGNAVTKQMWQSIETAAGVPIAAIGRDFTEQEGVPLIDVLASACAPGAGITKVTLRQGRFGLDSKSKSPQRWNVPVSARVVGSSGLARQVVSGPKDTSIDVPGCGAVKINPGETGYFRTRYDGASFARLARRFGELPAADQLGLLNDTFGLAEGGYLSFDRYFELAARVGPASDPMVAFQLANSLRSLDGYYAGFPEQAQFRSFARRRLGQILTHIGWNERHAEPANVSILRAQLIELLARFQDAEVIAAARQQFRTGSPPQIREALVRAAGAGADAAVFEELKSRAATHEQAEQRLFVLAAAGANDPAIAKRALDWMLTDAVPMELVPAFARAVAEQHPELAFDFAVANLNRLKPRLEEDAHAWLVPSLLNGSNDPRMVHKIDAFAARDLEARERRETVAPLRATIAFRDAVRRRLPSQWSHE